MKIHWTKRKWSYFKGFHVGVATGSGLGRERRGPWFFRKIRGNVLFFDNVFLSFNWATTALSKLIDSQQYILFIKSIIGRKKGVENLSRVWFEGESCSRMVSIQTLGFRGWILTSWFFPHACENRLTSFFIICVGSIVQKWAFLSCSLRMNSE